MVTNNTSEFGISADTRENPPIVGGTALERPSAPVRILEWIILGAGVGAVIALDQYGNWDWSLFIALAALGALSDVLAVRAPSGRIKLTGSFIALALAMIFLGGPPAALVAILTIGVSWLADRYPPADLLFNAALFIWFPLVGGVAFTELTDTASVTSSSGGFYLIALGIVVAVVALNFLLLFCYTAYVEKRSFRTVATKTLKPIIPSELFSVVLVLVIAFLYAKVGLVAIAFSGVVLFTFQYLLGQLLLSEQRAETLETRTHQLHARTKQLATLQVGVLSALMHTLDLRDRMTARHCAAVARYSREIAAEAGCSKEEQDLVHTAGLLHDIGKFIFPDSILKGDAPLTEDDWRIIRMHPYQGAKIVADVDGYGPVGDIILAHHERIDGGGYPRGLGGDDIPKLSRMIAVADTYDVMTARDSYRTPMSSFEAIQELKRVAGKQLDAEYVDLFIEVLAGKDVRFRHGEDADFDAELGLEKRIDDYSALTGEDLAELAAMGDDDEDELDVAVGENNGRRTLVQRLTGADKDKTPVS